MQLLSQDCQSRIQCAACLKPFARSDWKPKELENAERLGTTLVCASCRNEGCTANDPNYYMCKVCKTKKGSKRFSKMQLENHKYNSQPKLECLQCQKEASERVRVLHARFKQSKWFCKCGNPIHDGLKCPLSTVVYNKRRWPGGDLDEHKRQYITEEDSKFLSGLTPRPTWWANALRKPK